MNVAVIDIGSNSIKILVASGGAAGAAPVALFTKTLDARIGAGISKANPALTEESMARGLAAIRDLLADAARFAPGRVVLAATSAVRDAANSDGFCRLVLGATGHCVRILTGDEEAALIGRGLACDPALAGLRDFHVFDLGGGSLECLTFRGRRPVRETSLQLGCVRLTEKFVADPALPVPPGALGAINAHVKAALAGAARAAGAGGGFVFDLPAGAVCVVAGGTTTTARAMLGAAAGKTLAETSASLSLADLRALLARVAGAGLDARRAMPGMPFGRADVFPAALAVMVALAEAGGFDALQTSLYNLRWGLADEVLGRG